MTSNDCFRQLKIDKRVAHENKQRAQIALNDTAFSLSEAVDDAHVAYRGMRIAYRAKAEAQDAYTATSAVNKPLIEPLNLQIREAHENAGQAYEDSRRAYHAGDHATAREKAEERVHYVEVKRSHSAKRSSLLAKIQSARITYEKANESYRAAVDSFKAAKALCESLVTAHEKAECAHRSACNAFEAADQAVQDHITSLSISGEKALVVQAGVPSEFVDRTWVRYTPDGNRHLYFGGNHLPDGSNHAHYVVQIDDSVIYARDPHTPRGPHNFVRIVEFEEVPA